MATVRKSSSKEALPPDPMLPEQFQISRFRRETSDTFTMEFKPLRGPKKFVFRPGQFNMLYIFGVGEVPISISGDPTNSEVLIHTTRAVGSVTKALGKLKVGDTIGIRGPLGTSWPVEAAEGNDVVIITGGIGLAPLRPAIYYIMANRGKYGKVVILYGARTPGDLLYRAEVEKWCNRRDMNVQVTVDRGDAAWRGNVGVVTTLIGRESFDQLNCTVMVCGPEIMMHFTLLGLRKHGIDNKNIYVSMERNMKCGIGLCGHCQIGPIFVCKDGPVFRYDDIKELFSKREL